MSFSTNAANVPAFMLPSSASNISSRGGCICTVWASNAFPFTDLPLLSRDGTATSRERLVGVTLTQLDSDALRRGRWGLMDSTGRCLGLPWSRNCFQGEVGVDIGFWGESVAEARKRHGGSAPVYPLRRRFPE
jgi:hypothetical protein